MADLIPNIALAAVAEKFRANADNGIVLLLESAEADGTLRDYDELDALLTAAGNTEAAFTNYARKTGLTGTVTVDDSNDRVDVDIPDQTWSSAGNGTNETLAKLIVAHEDDGGSTDEDRVPCVILDFTPTTDGSDLTAEFDSAGFLRAEEAA